MFVRSFNSESFIWHVLTAIKFGVKFSDLCQEIISFTHLKHKANNAL